MVRLRRAAEIAVGTFDSTIDWPVATERCETNITFSVVPASNGSLSQRTVVSLQGFPRKLRCIETFASSFVPHFRRFMILNTSASHPSIHTVGLQFRHQISLAEFLQFRVGLVAGFLQLLQLTYSIVFCGIQNRN